MHEVKWRNRDLVVFPLLLGWITLVLCLAALSTTASAQQIMIQQEKVIEALDAEGFGGVEIANGPFFYSGQNFEDTDISPFLPIMLAVLTHDQIAAGAFTIETEIHTLIPETIEEKPFEVAIRVGHLLTHSAGFALPAIDRDLYRGDHAPLLIRQRTPGRLISDDPVGLMLLAKILEAATNTPLNDLLYRRFLEPLGLHADQITLNDTTLLSGQIGRLARAEILGLYGGRRTINLAKDMRESLFDTPLVEPFRGGLYASLGLVYDSIDSTAMVRFKGADSCMLGFPQSGLAFWFDTTRACEHPYPRAIRDISQNQIIDRATSARLKLMQNPPAGIRYPDRFAGHYLLDTPPRADLKSRLIRLYQGGLRVRTLGDGSLLVQSDVFSRILKPIRAYAYKDDAGNELIFSTYRRGGFLIYEGQTYSDRSLLARRSYVLWPVPFMVLTLFSAGLYWREKTAPEWRRMARLGVFASLFITAGIGLETAFYTSALYGGETGMWLITGWRLLLNAGLAFGLSVAILALIISRNKLPTRGIATLIAPLHLALLAASGVGLIVMMAAWGIAGSLWPL